MIFVVLFCLFIIETSFAMPVKLDNTTKPKIIIISSSPNEVAIINKVANDSNVKNIVNVTAKLGTTYANLSFDLDGDLIIFGTRSGLSAPVWETLKPKLEKAKKEGSTIMICVEPSTRNNYAPILGFQTVSTSDPRFNKTLAYLEYTCEKNIKNLILYLAASFFNCTVSFEPPEQRPLWGIYHPDAPKVFSNLTEYLEWYIKTGKYHSDSPTVGIITTEYSDMARDRPLLDKLVKTFELKNCNVIVSTYTYRDPNSLNYLMINGTPAIDAAIVISRGSTLNSQNWTKGIEDLQKLNVTVLNGIRIFSTNVTLDTWENSIEGVPSAELYQLAFAEMDGIIEPIVISVKALDPETGVIYNKPIDHQVEWLVNRTISWMKLKRLNNWNKKIVITYYSEDGGKANIGADIDYYLNAPESIATILKALKERGYNLGNKTLPSGSELAKLMAEIGSNIGTWAPGELQKRIKLGQVILIPEDEYLKWFNELPPEKQKEVIDVWGPPPGKIMVYTNGTKKYIVIPKLEFGNVLLLPEPVWGWLQNKTTLYNVGKLPPTHNLLAFYWWIKKVFGANAILSIFSLVELMPGKQNGLSSKDWGAIMLQDMPIIHVLPTDAPAIFDKRRANMLIINFMPPVLCSSELYGNFSELYENIKLYKECADDMLKNAYKNKIIYLAKKIGFNYKNDNFDEFVANITAYLEDIKNSYIPKGSHILGKAPEGDELLQLLIAMLPEIRDQNTTLIKLLLKECIINNLTPEEAQMKIIGKLNVNLTNLLQLALDYAQRIRNVSNEITAILAALEGRYIIPGPRGDPIRNPEVLPTGRNSYPFDPRTIPTKVAWETAVKLVDTFLKKYVNEHGTYPTKVAYVLWACETMRHQGIMEAEILYLMGVKPIWDSRGRIKGIELIENLTRPRIDVCIITSGLYRDLHRDMINLLDKAVKIAANANDTINYIKLNSEKIYTKLRSEGYNESYARELSLIRIFSEEPGAYSPGLQEIIPAANMWNEREELANFYIERLSSSYGENVTGLKNSLVFRENLRDVTVAMFSRSSNVYGVLDHPMVAAYFGGLSLAIEKVRGTKPEMYINNLRVEKNAKIETLEQFIKRDLISRYFNPKWLIGMISSGYDGARYMDSFVENLWIWQVTNPEFVSKSTWDTVVDVYVKDIYNLGLKQFFNTHNPWARQSLIATALVAAYKGFWKADRETLTFLAREYIESVNKYGVTCCHHTCGYIDLNNFIVRISNMPLPSLQKFAAAFAEATGVKLSIPGIPTTPQPSIPGAPSQLGAPTALGRVGIGTAATRGVSPGISGPSGRVGGEVGARGAAQAAGAAGKAGITGAAAGKGAGKAYEITPVSKGIGKPGIPFAGIIGVIILIALIAAGYLLRRPER
nr:cobaltochelatase subunit CobN [Methanothermus fervidus]